jgi:ERCC4-type nuclease
MSLIKKARSEGKLTSKLPTINVSDVMREQVEHISKEQGVTIGDVVRTAVEQFAARYEKSKQKKGDNE